MPGNQNLNWLAGIGGVEKSDQVSLNHTATALVELAEFLIAEAEHNLDKNGNRATGKTAASMKVVNVQTNATRMSLDIEIAKEYKFIDQGVKGVESGKSYAGYSFKTKYPNKKMALALLKWVKNRRVVSKYKPHSSHSDNLKGAPVESKNKEIKAMSNSASSQKSLAYAIATNIKKRGIKPTKFFTNAVAATKKEQKKRFADAFKLDIIETLNKN